MFISLFFSNSIELEYDWFIYTVTWILVVDLSIFTMFTFDLNWAFDHLSYLINIIVVTCFIINFILTIPYILFIFVIVFLIRRMIQHYLKSQHFFVFKNINRVFLTVARLMNQHGLYH